MPPRGWNAIGNPAAQKVRGGVTKEHCKTAEINVTTVSKNVSNGVRKVLVLVGRVLA